MIRSSMMGLLTAAAFASACNGKADSAGTPAADSTAVAPAAVPDSAASRDSAAKPAPDSAMAPPATKAAPKQETGDYDKAVRPRFKVDEKTGKIDTIKRP